MPRSGGTPRRRRISDRRAAAMTMTQSKPLADTPWLDPRATAQILIDGVSKTFGTHAAVDNVTLHIYKGEMFALVGASGCGKTTLLRMLAGFAHPSSGRICIDGVEMSAVPPHQRPVNMMFQSYALFPHMTVEDNVGYGLRRLPLDRATKKQRIQEALDMGQLGPLAQRKPHQPSGGQPQLMVDHAGHFSVGQRVWVALRPEKVRLGKQPVSAARVNQLRGTVWELGYLGNHSIYQIKTATGKLVTVFAQNERRTSEAAIDWSDEVFVSWGADAAGLLQA